MKEVWKNHFKRLLIEKTEREAIVSIMGMEVGVYRKEFIKRK